MSKSRIKCSRLDKQGITAKKIKKMIWALAKRWFPPTVSTESELLILAGTFGDEPFRLLATHHLVVAGSGELDPATTAGRRVSCGAQIYEIKRHIQTAVVDEIRNHALLNEGPGGTMKVESKMSTVAKGLPKRLALNNASESAIRIMLALVASDQNTRHEWDAEADAAAAVQAQADDSPPPLQQHRSWQQKFLERCEQELDVPLLSETARHRFWTTARQNHWRLTTKLQRRDATCLNSSRTSPGNCRCGRLRRRQRPGRMQVGSNCQTLTLSTATATAATSRASRTGAVTVAAAATKTTTAKAQQQRRCMPKG